jgi:hypothetical protein
MLDVPPPGAGFTTVTGAVPAGTVAGTTAVIWVSLTAFAGTVTPPIVTAEPMPKFEPEIVIVCPVATGEGWIEFITGTSDVIVKSTELDDPPGAGFFTTTEDFPKTRGTDRVIFN